MKRLLETEAVSVTDTTENESPVNIGKAYKVFIVLACNEIDSGSLIVTTKKIITLFRR